MGRRDRDVEFERLYRAEFPRLVRSLALVYGTESAADGVQEAFLAAHRSWARIAGYGDPAAWVRRVAVNKLSTERRTRIRRARIVDSLRPPDAVVGLSSAHEVMDLLAALPARQRVTACLFYVADYSVDEIADAMGVTAGTVKSQLSAARSHVQKMEI